MTTPITRLCPHCQRDYDISHRMHSNRVYCLCGGWSAVVMFPDGRTELRPCDAPDGSAAAGETTEAAALVLEMNAMRVELEAVQAEAAALRTAATDLYNQLQALRHPDMSTLWRLGGRPLEDAFEAQKAALISGAGRSLLAELEAAREDNAILLAALRDIDISRDELPERVRRLLNRIQQAEHPGRALMAELTKQQSDMRRACEDLIAAMVQLGKEHHREVAFARSVLGAPQ